MLFFFNVPQRQGESKMLVNLSVCYQTHQSWLLQSEDKYLEIQTAELGFPKHTFSYRAGAGEMGLTETKQRRRGGEAREGSEPR